MPLPLQNSCMQSQIDIYGLIKYVAHKLAHNCKKSRHLLEKNSSRLSRY